MITVYKLKNKKNNKNKQEWAKNNQNFLKIVRKSIIIKIILEIMKQIYKIFQFSIVKNNNIL